MRDKNVIAFSRLEVYGEVLEIQRKFPTFFKNRNILDYIDMIVLDDKPIQNSSDMMISVKFIWTDKQIELPKEIKEAFSQSSLKLPHK